MVDNGLHVFRGRRRTALTVHVAYWSGHAKTDRKELVVDSRCRSCYDSKYPTALVRRISAWRVAAPLQSVACS